MAGRVHRRRPGGLGHRPVKLVPKVGAGRAAATVGAGQQQFRDLWANIGAYHLNLWVHTLVELWAWNKSQAKICDRSDSPWDDADRRPSHADRRKALQRATLQLEYSSLARCRRATRKIAAFARQLVKLAL